MGKLVLDHTFTARTEVNELLLQELDISTDLWGIKVTRVELRDIVPSKAVQGSMELQMAAERQKRAAIFSSEGQQDSDINSAQGKAQVMLLEAEAMKKAEILKAEVTFKALEVISQQINTAPNAHEALQFLLAQNYLDMGITIGNSESSKVILFIDPHNIVAILEGVRSAIRNQSNELTSLEQQLEKT